MRLAEQWKRKMKQDTRQESVGETRGRRDGIEELIHALTLPVICLLDLEK